MVKPVPTTKQKAKSLKKDIPKIPVVGVGASAGGLDAFKQLFQNMPKDTGIAFVLVQHLDPTHESMMVDLLSRYTDMKVVQVSDAMVVAPDHVYMIPPNKDLSINNGELYITAPAKPRGLRLPIDSFFRSLAEDQCERAICIVLSGTGSDGTLGLKAIKSYGGMAMVQSPNEAQYDGMPVSSIATGTVDYVLPVTEMGDALVKYVQHSYIRGFFGTDVIEDDESTTSYNSILAIIHTQLGHNLHYYKKNTLVRRIKRRMSIKQLDNMEMYVLYLRDNPDETIELFKDMLIGVTDFFRDTESWEVIEKVLIKKIESAKEQKTIRIWVSGCSTGEEAYTMAMMLIEIMTSRNMRTDFQIFATDIDANALEIARNGIYPESIATSLSAQRLKRFFTKEDEFYRVTPRLRDNIVFSEQNLISDPPFSKLDLISCRNLLIYLQSNVQGKIIDLFHFALKIDGNLMLGNSETIGQQVDLFDTISKKWRIFKKINSSHKPRVSFPILPNKHIWDRITEEEKGIKRPSVQIHDLARQALLAEYVPASVLVNRKYQILYHFGDTVEYLRYPTGETTDDLFSLLREGLVTRVRGAVHKSIRENISLKIQGARVKRQAKYTGVSFSVKPLSAFEGGDGIVLISFEDVQRNQLSNPNLEVNSDDEPIVKQLEYELNATKEDLQNTIEELETSNEELKASNEEVMSMNEELQSSNEELETSKEELQSLNEELNTVNSELQEKISRLEVANNDLTNLMNSTKNASIFLDSKLDINFFTPASKKLFNLIATDIGRPISDIVPKFDDPGLMPEIEKVIETLHPSSKDVKNEHGRWFSRRIMPYRTSDNRILGTVVTFDDITDIKVALESAKINANFKASILDHITEQVVFLDLQGKVQWSNQATIEFLGKKQADLIGLSCADLWVKPHGDACQNCPVLACLSEEKTVSCEVKCGENVYIQATPLKNDSGEITGMIQVRRTLTRPLKPEHQ